MGSGFSTIPSVAATLVILITGIWATGAGAHALQQTRSTGAPIQIGGRLIAPVATCPQADRTDLTAAAQEQSMLCMTDFARLEAGLPGLTPSPALELSASLKTRDILACDDFSHFACGREFTYWIRSGGYMSVPCWHVGENIAWGRAGDGSTRSIFVAFMRSELHRHNILGDYTAIGVATRVGSLGWQGKVQVWTEHFGSHC